MPDNWRPTKTGRNKFFQAQCIEISRKVFKKIALKWIVAVAKNDLVTQLVAIMFEFIRNVPELGIKLVVFGLARFM